MKGHAKGDRVLHVRYGPGTLTDVNEQHTVVDFDDHGVRKFSTKLATFEPTQIAAPAPRPKASRKTAPKAAPRS